MTRDQKTVAVGAVSGILTMLTMLVVLSSVIAGLPADATAGERLAYAVQWIALGALPLVLAIGSVGNARFSSEAIDPTAGKESPATAVNCRVVDNTVQQFLLFGAASLAIAGAARRPAWGGSGWRDHLCRRSSRVLDRLSHQAAVPSRWLLLDLLSEHHPVWIRDVGRVVVIGMTARAAQYLLASVFFVLGGWCLVAPGMVMTLAFTPAYQSSEPIVPILVACFGAQAVLAGIFAAFSIFTRRTFLAYGLALLPFFVFDYWFYAVEPMLTEVGLLDVIGNLIMLWLCWIGWKRSPEIPSVPSA